MKSILGVGYQWDSRNDALLASTGRLFRLDLEASPSFVKGELELQSAGILSQREPRWSWSGKLVAGVVHGDAGPSDRFFLGGRSSVRGFLSEGIGPRDGSKFLGTAAGIDKVRRCGGWKSDVEHRAFVIYPIALVPDSVVPRTLFCQYGQLWRPAMERSAGERGSRRGVST